MNNNSLSGAAFRAWYDSLDGDKQDVVKQINARILFEPAYDNVSIGVSRLEVRNRAQAAFDRESKGGTIEGGITCSRESAFLTRSGLIQLSSDLLKAWWPDDSPSPEMIQAAGLWADDVFAEIVRIAEHAGSDVSYSEHDDGAELAAFVDGLKDEAAERWVWRA